MIKMILNLRVLILIDLKTNELNSETSERGSLRIYEHYYLRRTLRLPRKGKRETQTGGSLP